MLESYLFNNKLMLHCYYYVKWIYYIVDNIIWNISQISDQMYQV